MAKDKKAVTTDRDLGTIVKKDGSGFYITNKDEKIPGLNGLKVGDKIKLVSGEYIVNGGAKEEAPKDAGNLAEVNAKITALETELADVKTELGRFGTADAEKDEPKTKSGTASKEA